ncbi:hypothetical protein [Streptomyces hayashii]|uniref:hypothetical protein n=1 Tax=Streptomyces hayashii TaxID=2839966 RepID=UPI00403C88EA
MSVGPRLMVMAMLLPVCGIPLLIECHVRRSAAPGRDLAPPSRSGRRVPAPASR